MSKHVLVVLKMQQCNACSSLENRWNKEYKGKLEALPIRIIHITTDPSQKIDPNIYPSGLTAFTGFRPMFILIPGQLWDEATSKLGSNNPIKFNQGVYAMGCTLRPNNTWDIPLRPKVDYNPDNIVKWIRDSLYSGKQIPPKIEPEQKKQPEKPENLNNSNSVCSLKIISRYHTNKAF